MAMHEREYRRNRGKTTNPRLVMMDFNWVIILACLNEFCGCGLDEYLNRTYRIVTDTATKEDIGKTIVHICLAHVMNMNRRECRKLFEKDICCKSKVHFCMRFLACLVNTRTLGESVELMRSAYFLMNSKYANKVSSTALHQIEKKVNTLNLDWKEEDDYMTCT